MRKGGEVIVSYLLHHLFEFRMGIRGGNRGEGDFLFSAREGMVNCSGVGGSVDWCGGVGALVAEDVCREANKGGG